jgi:hypothetical protein
MTFADAARLAAWAAARLGWRPADFWAATPAELRAALGLDLPVADPADRRLTARLMEQFPDAR